MANSTVDSLNAVPSIENFVNSNKIKINGSNIGNDKTGYKVPFEPVLAIIAAIIVEADAIPAFPSIKATRKSKKFRIINDSNNNEYRIVITIFIAKTRIRLNISLPLNMVFGAAIS